MAAMVLAWGYKLILIFSEKDSPVAKLVSAGTNVKPTLLIQHDNTHPNQDFAIAQTLESIDSQGSPILAILPGAETGVELCDKLAYRYKTRNNGELMTPARRNKYLMQERVRSCGVRAVQQKLCRSDADVDQFWADLTESNKGSSALNCVVKPNESAGTDSVYLCTTKEQVADAVKSIHNKVLPLSV